MGTLSGGGKQVISIGERCLLGANAGIGISLGDDCVVEAGLYVTAGTKVTPARRRRWSRRCELSGPERAAVPPQLGHRRDRGPAPRRAGGRAERRAARQLRRPPAPCPPSDARSAGASSSPCWCSPPSWSRRRRLLLVRRPRGSRLPSRASTAASRPPATSSTAITLEQAHYASIIAGPVGQAGPAAAGRVDRPGHRVPGDAASATSTTATATRSGCSSSGRPRAGAPRSR